MTFVMAKMTDFQKKIDIKPKYSKKTKNLSKLVLLYVIFVT